MKEVPVGGILQQIEPETGSKTSPQVLSMTVDNGDLWNFVRFFMRKLGSILKQKTMDGAPLTPCRTGTTCSTREDDMPAIQSSFHFSQEFNFAEYSRINAITVYCS